jgi:hypothetical protein
MNIDGSEREEKCATAKKGAEEQRYSVFWGWDTHFIKETRQLSNINCFLRAII